MKKFRHTYRIESARLRGWDYGSNAAYFVTICTGDQNHYFGEIRDGIMHLSEIGVIANSEWFKSPQIRPDMNLELGAFVVMPNHIHGIVIIGKNKFNQYHVNIDGNGCRDAMHCVSTKTIMQPSLNPKNRFGPQSKNLAAIIRGYKSAVTKRARQINPHFTWQSRYHDHIIRNPESDYNIENYIQNNVKDWTLDRFFNSKRKHN